MKDKMYGSRPAAAGRGERVAANAALLHAPSPGRAFCKHHRLSRRCPAAPGCAWLFSWRSEQRAEILAWEHGTGIHIHHRWVPAPPGWEFDYELRARRGGQERAASLDEDYSVTPRFAANFWQDCLNEAMSKVKQPAGGRYRDRQGAARGANRLDVPTPRHHAITVAAAHVTRPGVSLQAPRRRVDL